MLNKILTSIFLVLILVSCNINDDSSISKPEQPSTEVNYDEILEGIKNLYDEYDKLAQDLNSE